MKFKVILILFTFCLLPFTFCGCEAFQRKFVRKPKQEKEIKIVTQTQEYPSEYSVAVAYKKYFLFWQAAQDELINLLEIQDGNRKKQLFTAEKTIENLRQMQQFLLSEKQNELDVYILEQQKILEQLTRGSLSRGRMLQIKSLLEKQRRNIKTQFALKSIKDFLSQR